MLAIPLLEPLHGVMPTITLSGDLTTAIDV